MKFFGISISEPVKIFYKEKEALKIILLKFFNYVLTFSSHNLGKLLFQLEFYLSSFCQCKKHKIKVSFGENFSLPSLDTSESKFQKLFLLECPLLLSRKAKKFGQKRYKSQNFSAFFLAKKTGKKSSGESLVKQKMSLLDWKN